MQRRQCRVLRSGCLFLAVLFFLLLAVETQLHASNKSHKMSPSSPSSVDVPANATLDYTGQAWECKHGYQRSGDQCAAVALPANATLDYTGHTWECKHGYQRSGNQCAAVALPANATLDYTGHTWECKRGYQRSGNQCAAVALPANATLDYYGHTWECEHGYRRVGDACEKMTALPVSKTALDGSSAVQESQVDPQQQNDAKGMIRQIQAQLKQAGFDPGPMDGILGPRTIKALHQYLTTR
jgi:hypothetical protein